MKVVKVAFWGLATHMDEICFGIKQNLAELLVTKNVHSSLSCLFCVLGPRNPRPLLMVMVYGTEKGRTQ